MLTLGATAAFFGPLPAFTLGGGSTDDDSREGDRVLLLAVSVSVSVSLLSTCESVSGVEEWRGGVERCKG